MKKKKTKKNQVKQEEPHKLYNFVIGLSGPYGSGCSSLREELYNIFSNWPGCHCEKISVSQIIENWSEKLAKFKVEESASDSERRRSYQQAGNSIRNRKHDLIGKLVASEISTRTKEYEENGKLKRVGTIIYIVDSLKNKSDYESLKYIYRDEFFFCFITANTEIRWSRMRNYKSWKENEKHDFLEIDGIDSDEEKIDPKVADKGQQVRKLASLADYYFVNNVSRKDLQYSAYRFACLLFGHGINQPTKDEKSMHIAFSCANQSACLSRQVGAAIFSKEGNILAVGHNDVPKYKGGLYSIEDIGNDNRCLNLGDRRCINDTNKDERFKTLENQITTEFNKYFKRYKTTLPKEIKKTFKIDALREINELISKAIRKSEFKDATEYCRAVHAEMDALMSVARNVSGSTLGSIIYVTTEPCHNCVKHIIAAGVEQVVYIEPYPKSLGEELHSDAISLNPQKTEDSTGKVCFMPYQGVAPRRYHEFFDMLEKRKDEDGKMCYTSKKACAFSPKFGHRVIKRTRIIHKTSGDSSLITANEIVATTDVATIAEMQP